MSLNLISFQASIFDWKKFNGLFECFQGLSINSRWLLPLNAQDCSSWLNENHIMDLFRLFSNTCTCTFLLKIVNSLSEKSWNTSFEVDSMTNCPKFLEPSDGQYLGYTWQKLYAIKYILYSRYHKKITPWKWS